MRMMEVDAVDYFRMVEERQEPADALSREDRVLLALLDRVRTPGRCAACGDDLGECVRWTRWCEKCGIVANRFVDKTRKDVYYIPADPIKCKCGKVVIRPRRTGGSIKRCPECQTAFNKAENARRNRERYWKMKQRQEAV